MSDKKVFKMTDDLIAVIRELVQLTFITGTNIVDHLRAVELEIDEKTNKMIPTEEYVLAYNEMVEKLVEQASEAQKELDPSLKEGDEEFTLQLEEHKEELN